MLIKQLLHLYAQQISNRQIAIRLGMSRNTVNRYVRFFKNHSLEADHLVALPEEELVALFPVADEKKKKTSHQELIGYFPKIKKASLSTGFTFYKCWQEYKTIYTNGYQYSQFMHHYRKWDAPNDCTLKLHHKAGEKLMVDYAGKKLSYVDKQTGEVIEVEVFVGCLPASGYTYVEASASQRKEDFINSMTNCLNFIGGVPQMIIPDNLKSAVTKGSKYEAIANRSLRDLGLHYGSILNPTRPYSPKDKALVERMVKLVYEQIYFTIRNEIYHSIHQLNERIAELLEKLNERKLSQLDTSRKALFEETELPELKPLPPQAYQIKEYQRAKVQKTSHVYLSVDKHYYSVPYRYIGKHIRLHYTNRTVEIYYNHERIATHFRNKRASGYTTKKEHLPSNHQFYMEWSPDFFIKKATRTGPYSKRYVERLFEQTGHPEPKYKIAMGIVQLHKLYEQERIEKACQLAMEHPVSSYQRVLNILKKKLDQCETLFEDKEQSQEDYLPQHENIRGQEYYSDLLNQSKDYESNNQQNEPDAHASNGANPPPEDAGTLAPGIHNG